MDLAAGYDTWPGWLLVVGWLIAMLVLAFVLGGWVDRD